MKTKEPSADFYELLKKLPGFNVSIAEARAIYADSVSKGIQPGEPTQQHKELGILHGFANIPVPDGLTFFDGVAVEFIYIHWLTCEDMAGMPPFAARLDYEATGKPHEGFIVILPEDNNRAEEAYQALLKSVTRHYDLWGENIMKSGVSASLWVTKGEPKNAMLFTLFDYA